jgi:hypothetical protein
MLHCNSSLLRCTRLCTHPQRKHPNHRSYCRMYHSSQHPFAGWYNPSDNWPTPPNKNKLPHYTVCPRYKRFHTNHNGCDPRSTIRKHRYNWSAPSDKSTCNCPPHRHCPLHKHFHTPRNDSERYSYPHTPRRKASNPSDTHTHHRYNTARCCIHFRSFRSARYRFVCPYIGSNKSSVLSDSCVYKNPLHTHPTLHKPHHTPHNVSDL